MNRKKLYILISGLLAIAFTIYAVLDTFVISETYVVVQTAAADTGESASENDDTTSGAGTEDNGSGNSAAESSEDNGSGNSAAESSEDNDGENSAAEDSVSGSTAAEASGESGSKPQDQSSGDAEGNISGTSDAAVITDTSYSDGNINITITSYREYDTDIYVADITLSSADYLQTAFAKASYGKNITEKTSETADSVGAILAINGDYYGVQESGYVIREGVLYRSLSKGDQEDLVIYQDGSMEIINENDITAEELMEKGAWNVLCFGPGLLENGEIQVTTDQEVDKAMTSNPRTAIGMIDDLHYVFVVADGRTTASAGLSLYQLAEFMQSLGVQTAYNLDGGGSSTMVFNGTVINNPASGHSSSGRLSGKSSSSSSASSSTGSSSGTSGSSERSVSDIVYIGY